jgi:hypothetical protein
VQAIYFDGPKVVINETEKEPPKMILNKAKLKELVIEELTQARCSKSREKVKNPSKWTRIDDESTDERSDRERKEDRFPGYEDFKQISNGIVEFNTGHDDEGKFSTHEDSECDSSYFKDGERSSRKVKLKDKSEAGRGKKKHSGKGKYLCKTGKKHSQKESKDWETLFKDFSTLNDEDDECQREEKAYKNLKRGIKSNENSTSQHVLLTIEDAKTLRDVYETFLTDDRQEETPPVPPPNDGKSLS